MKRLLRLPRPSAAAVCEAGSGTPSPLNYHEITLNFKDSFIKTQVLPSICDDGRDAADSVSNLHVSYRCKAAASRWRANPCFQHWFASARERCSNAKIVSYVLYLLLLSSFILHLTSPALKLVKNLKKVTDLLLMQAAVFVPLRLLLLKISLLQAVLTNRLCSELARARSFVFLSALTTRQILLMLKPC